MPEPQALWQAWGQNDPYYAVLSTDRYHSRNFGPAREEEFFLSGKRHLEHVLRETQRRLGGFRRGRALDYGCGVGRVVVPMGVAFQSAVGADVSAAMLGRAASRVARAGLSNVELVVTRDGGDLPGQFDLIHTFIVLQHNRPGATRRILQQLIARLSVGGVGVVNLTYWRNAPLWRRAHGRLRRSFRPYDFAVSLMQRRNPWLPSIPMYVHNMNRIFFLFGSLGVSDVSLEFVPQTAGFESVTLYLRKTRSGGEVTRA